MNAATDTLFSTLTSCLDHICPLSSRPARAAPSNPWLSDVLREHRSKLRAAERKWHKSNDPSVSLSLCFHLSLLKSILPRPHISTTRSTAHLTHAISSKHSNLSSVYTSRNRWQNITFSSTWQRLSFLSSLPLQLYSIIHHLARFFYNYPIKFSKKSWCYFRLPADFQRPHCKNCSILHFTTSEKSGPSLHSMQHNFLSRPLSFLDWTTALLF